MGSDLLIGKKHILLGGLMERLSRQSDDFDGNSEYASELDAMIGSIKINLDRVLNTRSGNSLSSHSMGVNDFNDAQMSSSNMLKIISDDIMQTILRYESRIIDPLVTPETGTGSPLRLSFKIQGNVQLNDRYQLMEFNLILEKGSACRIS